MLPAPHIRRLPALATAALLSLAGTSLACSGSDARADASRGATGARRPSGPAVIAATGYAPGAAGTGTVSGTVSFDGDAPADSAVKPATDADVCGASIAVQTVSRSAGGLGAAVVWLADVKTGKPLPLGRRFDVATERCAITPRVQAAVTGGTLDVSSYDELLHETRFTRQSTGDSLGMVSETEAGSVVPVRAPLAAAGLVEVSDARHPWERGWVAVFDHPYFAVTGADGRYALDSVPAGTYRLRAWHERFGFTEQTVTVGAGATTADVKLTAK